MPFGWANDKGSTLKAKPKNKIGLFKTLVYDLPTYLQQCAYFPIYELFTYLWPIYLIN
jgi:hypothetical protein